MTYKELTRTTEEEHQAFRHMLRSLFFNPVELTKVAIHEQETTVEGEGPPEARQGVGSERPLPTDNEPDVQGTLRSRDRGSLEPPYPSDGHFGG